MTTREFGANVAIVLAAMGLLALVELLAPLFARGARSRSRADANLGLGALTLLLHWALASTDAALAVHVRLQGRGLLAGLGLPAPALVAASVVALDFSTYLAHRSLHAIPFLWRAHSVHHGDPFVDVGTTLRLHPIETVWRHLWIALPVELLGLPAAGVVVYRLASVLQGLLEHANVCAWPRLDRALSRVVCTPNLHKVHHSRARAQTDSNFGNLLAVFDRGLRTFRSSDEAFGVVYGLDDVEAEQAKSLVALLALPFRRRRQPLRSRVVSMPP